MTTIRWACMLLMTVGSSGAVGCGDDEGVSDEGRARLAYMGFDRAVGLAMDLGFAGFNAASSANIPPQTGNGEVRGTLQVSGQVDQGASNNKGMRLLLAVTDYTDQAVAPEIPPISYASGATQPKLDLSLKQIPTGTLEGTLAGAFSMTGGLQGDVQLQLAIAGQLEPDPADASKVRRKPGTTQVTGTAISPFGTFQVDITR